MKGDVAMSEKSRSFTARIRDRYAMSERAGVWETVIVRGQRCATVYGCRKILLYSPREIRLCMGRRVLCVQGEGLLCTCFSAGSVTLEGKISGVFYVTEEEKKNGERDI